MMRVAAAIISDEQGKILICRRSAGSCSGIWTRTNNRQDAAAKAACLACQRSADSNAGLWEFPGGKQEVGESLTDCVVRECQEELGIVIKPGNVFGVEFYEKDGEIQEFTFLEAKLLAGTPELRVHSELCWADMEDLKNRDYCPADLEIVNLLCGQ